jgi:prepilin-type N-terminal cleavage/methylation domain-containing protein
MKSPFASHHVAFPPRLRSCGFSLVELLIAICALAVVAAIVIPSFAGSKTAVASAKLLSDVNILNNAVGLYVADGGRLNDATTYQQVIDRLKTKASSEVARRHVGPMTGRFIDPRLAARALTSSESSSNTPRATWDATQKKFVVTTSGAGIGSFYFDDAQAGVATAEETRDRSSMLFNRTDGWIWEWGGNAGPTPIAPGEHLGAGLVATSLEPLPAPPSSSTPPSGGGTTPPPTPPLPLPTPTILPIGGAFSISNFPSSILISAGGANSQYSMLQYRTNSGSWVPYSSAFSVMPGTRVYARNVSLDTSRYLDSPEDTEIYLQLVPVITGYVLPEWANMTGGDNLVHTLNNTDVNDIKADYGTPSNSGDAANNLQFRRTPVISAAPNVAFRVGEISYFNGTVALGTEAASVDLKLKIQILTPILASGTATAHLSLWSSPNTSDASDSADYAQLNNPVTDFTMQVDGITYALELKFANVKPEEGWTDGTKLYVFEDSNGHADIVGVFKSQ